ncbi:MAG: PorV/PorQ family protein [Bacteroidales bacterium]
MKNIYKCLVIALLTGILVIPSQRANAGNKDRSGQAGAFELLINPWARTAGWGSAGVACARGLEAQWVNVAGLAFTKSTEVNFSHTNYLKGAGISIVAGGFAKRINESSVFGVSVMNMGFGELPVTTVANPEGSGATFKPSYLNINLAYAKMFSNSIYGGFNLKIIAESLPDLTATGFAIDAGIQYVTGEEENIHFGVTLKNIGPTMKYTGDGISFRAFAPGSNYQSTYEQRSAEFELPASLSIGGAYDFLFADRQRFTVAANFQSNSFTQDLVIGGGEYSFKDLLMLRAGYVYEAGINENVNNPNRLTAHTGLQLGATVQLPLNKKSGSKLGIDYSYGDTDNFSGDHRVGIKLIF